ncbi:MAG: NUDIX domain-containing protein [Leptolyngbyaceae cyanobacterium bins.302]|nr:NUDIX domain-containing protein [Leptolyngbyaceae cyanobacterium bins.302]
MNETIRIRVGVAAYIVRKSAQGGYQLLFFTHPDCEEAPVQVPGGGVDAGETLEQALYREVWEESGLTELVFIRKLGMTATCWIQPRKLISQRHYFLLEAISDTPDQWQHTVKGDGIDAGTVFSYFWQNGDRDLPLLPDSGGAFLYPEHVPELFESRPVASFPTR